MTDRTDRQLGLIAAWSVILFLVAVLLLAVLVYPAGRS